MHSRTLPMPETEAGTLHAGQEPPQLISISWPLTLLILRSSHSSNQTRMEMGIP